MMHLRRLLFIVALLAVGARGLTAQTAPATSGTEDARGKVPLSTSSREALGSFMEGRTLFENLKGTDAISLFQKAVELDPNFAMSYLYLAQSAPTAKAFSENVEKAVNAAKNASEGERLWISGVRAGAYGDAAGQQEAFERLARLFPEDERAQTQLGTYHMGQQEYDQAAQNLKKAIGIAPGYAPAYNQLGYAYRFLGKFNEAERVFKKYTELIPNDPNPYDSYAELLLKMGRFDEAITEYRKALSIDPHFASSRYGIAGALMYQGKYDEARAELKQALDNARTDGEKRAALFNTALTYIDEGKVDLGLQELDREYAVAEKINDQGSMAADLTAKANVLLDMGKTDEAKTDFESALGLINGSNLSDKAKNNANLLFHYNIGRVLLHQGKLDQARSAAEQLRNGAEEKKNNNQIRLAHELVGMIAMEEKQFDAAAKELGQANQQDPYNLYRLALASQAMGKHPEAKELCNAAAHFNGLPSLNYALVRRKAESLLTANLQIQAGG